jgi:hypothetical protein
LAVLDQEVQEELGVQEDLVAVVAPAEQVDYRAVAPLLLALLVQVEMEVLEPSSLSGQQQHYQLKENKKNDNLCNLK